MTLKFRNTANIAVSATHIIFDAFHFCHRNTVLSRARVHQGSDTDSSWLITLIPCIFQLLFCQITKGTDDAFDHLFFDYQFNSDQEMGLEN